MLQDLQTRFDDGSLREQYAGAQQLNQMFGGIMQAGIQARARAPEKPPIPFGQLIGVNTTPEGTVDMEGVNSMLDQAGAKPEDYSRAADIAKRMSPQSTESIGYPLEGEIEYINPATGERKMMGNIQEGPMAGTRGYVDADTGDFIPKGKEWQIAYDKPATRTEMTTLKDTLIEAERGMKAAKRYMSSRDSARQGFDALADQVMLRVNTVLNKELTPEQLAQGVSESQFQGLLGQFRIETVGGGVMTEKDAERIIARLGGEPGLLANKELMSQLMQEIIEDKYAGYESALQDYAIARDTSAYNRKNYKEWQPLTFDFMQAEQSPEAPPQGGLPVVTSQEQYDALKSGDEYFDSAGTWGRKP
jgi:hypothetical protein